MNLDTLSSQIEALRQQNGIPGMSVAVTLMNDIVFEQAFGVADLQMQTPLAADAVFPIGSITKTFIATLLMQLVEQGVVGLTDPLRRYIPEYPHSVTTLQQLAAHTSGLGRDAAVNYPMNYSLGPWSDSGGRTPLEWYVPSGELLASLSTVELETDPDSGKVYSNLGVCLLGMALERAAGQPMAQLLAERIFARLDMTASQFVFSHDELLPALAKRLPPGYVFTYQGPLTAPAWHLGCAAYSGGICCSASDLARFLAFHLSPRTDTGVLRLASVQRMRPAHSSGDAYLGWWKGWHAGHDNFGHAGGHLGYLATALGIPALQLGVVVLTNRFSPVRFEDHATDITKKLLETLAPQAADAVHLADAAYSAAFDPTHVDLRPYEGSYTLAGGYTPLKVVAAAGKLTLSWLDRPYPTEVYIPIAPDQFTPQGSPFSIPLLTFTRSEAGAPEILSHALFTFRKTG
jgi:CubicO group peptidase (beta-lactamase class C family)